MTDHFSEGTTVAAPCSVLIIEDNADGRESLRTLLQLLGYRVEVAMDGVTVSCLCPGYTKTNFHAVAGMQGAEATPFPEMTPDAVAAIFLASSATEI